MKGKCSWSLGSHTMIIKSVGTVSEWKSNLGELILVFVQGDTQRISLYPEREFWDLTGIQQKFRAFKSKWWGSKGRMQPWRETYPRGWVIPRRQNPPRTGKEAWAGRWGTAPRLWGQTRTGRGHLAGQSFPKWLQKGVMITLGSKCPFLSFPFHFRRANKSQKYVPNVGLWQQVRKRLYGGLWFTVFCYLGSATDG